MDHPDLIVSNYMDDFIGLQRVDIVEGTYVTSPFQ